MVYHLLVALLAGTGLVKAVLLAQEHDGSYAGVVVRLPTEHTQTTYKISALSLSHDLCFCTLNMLTGIKQHNITCRKGPKVRIIIMLLCDAHGYSVVQLI